MHTLWALAVFYTPFTHLYPIKYRIAFAVYTSALLNDRMHSGDVSLSDFLVWILSVHTQASGWLGHCWAPARDHSLEQYELLLTEMLIRYTGL